MITKMNLNGFIKVLDHTRITRLYRRRNLDMQVIIFLTEFYEEFIFKLLKLDCKLQRLHVNILKTVIDCTDFEKGQYFIKKIWQSV